MALLSNKESPFSDADKTISHLVKTKCLIV